MYDTLPAITLRRPAKASTPISIHSLNVYTWLEVAMNELLISLDDVKVYYDNQGQASEVLMSYETFLQI